MWPSLELAGLIYIEMRVIPCNNALAIIGYSNNWEIMIVGKCASNWGLLGMENHHLWFRLNGIDHQFFEPLDWDRWPGFIGELLTRLWYSEIKNLHMI